jgi:hypothetical protein
VFRVRKTGLLRFSAQAGKRKNSKKAAHAVSLGDKTMTRPKLERQKEKEQWDKLLNFSGGLK